MDVCGVDYSTYGDGRWDGPRFAAVYHLLSITHNRRVRMRVFAPDDDFPVVDSVVGIGLPPTGSSGRHSISTASSLPAIPICAAFSRTTASSVTRSARTFRCPAPSRCATTRISSA